MIPIKHATYFSLAFALLLTQVSSIHTDAFTDFFTKTIPQTAKTVGTTITQTAQDVGTKIQEKAIDPLVAEANKLPQLATQVVDDLLRNVPTDAAQRIEALKASVSTIQTIVSNLQQQLTQANSVTTKAVALIENIKRFQTQIQEFLKTKTAQDIFQAWFFGDSSLEDLFTLHDTIVEQVNNLDLRPLLGTQTKPGIAGILSAASTLIDHILALRDIFNHITIIGIGSLGSLVISDPQASAIQTLRSALSTMAQGAQTMASGALNPLNKSEGKLIKVAINTPARLNELIKLQQILVAAQNTINQLSNTANSLQKAAETIKNEAAGLHDYVKAKVDQKAQDWRIWLGVGVSGAAVLAATAIDALKERIQYLKQKTAALVFQARYSATLVQQLISNTTSVLSTIKNSTDIDLYTQPVLQGITLLQQGNQQLGQGLQALASAV